MKLITAECLWLECCNCGAVYEDIWSDIQKEIPVCLYCGWSWYQNTEKYKRHGPTKEHYRKAPPLEISLSLSSRWQRYQKLIVVGEMLLADEWIVHETAWRLSKAEKINIVYFIQAVMRETIERVLGWRGLISYREIPWPNDVTNKDGDSMPWEKTDVSQDTERQAFALIELKTFLSIWDSMANSGLTLWEALALRSPGSDTTTKEYRFYKKVKNELLRFRRRCVEKL